MGARGPAPKPTALKVAQGNPGRRKLTEGEPLPPPGEISPPAWLSKRARRVWDSAAPIAIAMRTLTTADVLTFGRYCEYFARWLVLKTKFDRDDDTKAFATTVYVVKNEQGGVRYMAPLPQSIEFGQLHTKLKDLEDRFGLNASARSRIRVESGGSAPPAADASPAAKSGGTMRLSDYIKTRPA